MKKKVVRTKIYSVDWVRNGFCYRTTMGCTWEDVKQCKRTAKLLGETIKYEHYYTKEDVYTLQNMDAIVSLIGILTTPIAKRKGVTLSAEECEIWAEELKKSVKNLANSK